MKDIKTATLTFHAPNNNGSFLQAYALQQVFNKAGVANEIVDFYTDKQKRQYSVFRIPKSIGDIMRNLISLVHYFDLKSRFVKFEELRKVYLKTTAKCKIEEEVYQLLSEYDVVICGSDQIWNTEARDFSEAYLLVEYSGKKVAYAVSCGSDISNINKEKIISAVEDFEVVSVRETAIGDFIRGITGKEIRTVLDPTLLLNKEDYFCLYDTKPILQGKYILLYTINYSDEIMRQVCEIAKEYGLKVYTPFTGYSAYKCRKYKIKVLYDIGPADFLNLIDNATYVCTNSFHGVAFSIIYRKNFYRLCNVDANGKQIIDERIDDVLNRFGLKTRNVYLNNWTKEDVNYNLFEEKFNDIRRSSVEYLISSIYYNDKERIDR